MSFYLGKLKISLNKLGSIFMLGIIIHFKQRQFIFNFGKHSLTLWYRK